MKVDVELRVKNTSQIVTLDIPDPHRNPQAIPHLNDDGSLKTMESYLKDCQRSHLIFALSLHDSQVQKVSQLLQISIATIYRMGVTKLVKKLKEKVVTMSVKPAKTVRLPEAVLIQSPAKTIPKPQEMIQEFIS